MEEQNIYQKMLAISEETEAIPKNGWNDYSKYKYVRAIDLIGHVKKLLIKHRVHLDVKEVSLNRITEGKNFHSSIQCVGIFTNVDNPDEKIEVPYFSVSADTLDKDIFKAKTNGLKYLLSQTFKILTDDFIDTELTSEAEKPQYISDDQVATITALATEVNADFSKFVAYFKIEDLDKMLVSDYPRAIALLEKKRQ